MRNGMRGFGRFFHDAQQDGKVFLYLLLLFCLARMVFIVLFRHQLNGVSPGEIALCLGYGLRISLKTAGMMTAIGLLLSTVPHIVFPRWPAARLRLFWQAVVLVFFTLCFFIRIPYYQTFDSAFDMMLINGLYDDAGAIWDTIVEDYQPFWRLSAAAMTAGGLVPGLRGLLHTRTFTPILRSRRALVASMLATVLVFPPLFIFVRFGGALSFQYSINWESAARLKSHMLNEAILDDGQALYRVYDTYRKQRRFAERNIDAREIRAAIALLGGQPDAATIEDAFARKMSSPQLPSRPENVVFILGENYALFPLLPEYQALGLADQGLRLQRSSQAMSVRLMLPSGSTTISAVNGLLSGLHNAGFFTNYEPRSFKSRYAMGIGNQMKKSGYRTVFWYGGFENWQNIKRFALAQGFDEFYGASGFNDPDGNSWGVSDKYLLQKVEERLRASGKGEKIFTFILTTSNHTPLTIDVVKEGFDMEDVRAKLPPDIPDNAKTLRKLGHIWYADREIGRFVGRVEQMRPDTLFILTGDHAQRFEFARTVENQSLYAVPCIFFGRGVNPRWMPENTIGSHLHILPTLASLVGEPGESYSSLFPSLLAEGGQTTAFNDTLWTNGNVIAPLNAHDPDTAAIARSAQAARTVTIWRIKKGNQIGADR
ncbi:MAG: LTA synthase family protein [Zoogloeaceae bacterium]|nr:LTA synthase family protein [Zoogloeaceae bacterium]